MRAAFYGRVLGYILGWILVAHTSVRCDDSIWQDSIGFQTGPNKLQFFSIDPFATPQPAVSAFDWGVYSIKEKPAVQLMNIVQKSDGSFDAWGVQGVVNTKLGFLPYSQDWALTCTNASGKSITGGLLNAEEFLYGLLTWEQLIGQVFPAICYAVIYPQYYAAGGGTMSLGASTGGRSATAAGAPSLAPFGGGGGSTAGTACNQAISCGVNPLGPPLDPCTAMFGNNPLVVCAEHYSAPGVSAMHCVNTAGQSCPGTACLYDPSCPSGSVCVHHGCCPTIGVCVPKK